MYVIDSTFARIQLKLMSNLINNITTHWSLYSCTVILNFSELINSSKASYKHTFLNTLT